MRNEEFLPGRESHDDIPQSRVELEVSVDSGEKKMEALSQKNDDDERIKQVAEKIREMSTPQPERVDIDIEDALFIIGEAVRLLDDDFEDSGGGRYRYFSDKANVNLIPWGEELFKLAKSSRGEERCRYAEALENLNFLVEKESYNRLLRENLLTNKVAITELYHQGLREIGYKNPEKEIVLRDMRKTYGVFARPILFLARLFSADK